MNATHKTPADKAGTILSPAIWDALAAEYLDDLWSIPTGIAVRNAGRLSGYVRKQFATGAEADHYRLVADGVRWVETENPEPYADLDGMVRAWLHGTVEVSNQHCDHPVWTVTENVRFRVWHDTTHVLLRAGFDPDGELQVFAHQARGLADLGGQREVEALFCESVYQLAACLHLGGFPDRQSVITPGPVGEAVLSLLLAL